MKALNLYAGIGGNRKLWKDVEVTAVESNESIADAYKKNFPNDKIIIDDAHQYLLDNYDKYDFIWASPPCQSHSRMNTLIVGQGQRRALYPDMKLWQEIIFLKSWFKGRFVVENVIPMYEPLIHPTKEIERHYFWSNFRIPNFRLNRKRPSIERGSVQSFEDEFNMSVKDHKFEGIRKIQVLHNCVHPEVGNHIFLAAKNIYRKKDCKQSNLF